MTRSSLPVQYFDGRFTSLLGGRPLIWEILFFRNLGKFFSVSFPLSKLLYTCIDRISEGGIGGLLLNAIGRAYPAFCQSIRHCVYGRPSSRIPSRRPPQSRMYQKPCSPVDINPGLVPLSACSFIGGLWDMGFFSLAVRKFDWQ